MSLQEEVKLHVDYCNRFGISEKDMAACEEDPGKCIVSGAIVELVLNTTQHARHTPDMFWTLASLKIYSRFRLQCYHVSWATA